MVPQSIASKIADDVNEVLFNRVAPDEFTSRRIQRDAEKLTKLGNEADVSAGYTVLGILAGLNNEAEEMHRNHKAAISLLYENAELHLQYASSLRHSGFLAEALPEIRLAAQLAPNNAQILSNAVDLFTHCGHFQEAYKLTEQLISGDEITSTLFITVKRVSDFLISSNIEDQELRRYLAVVREVLLKHGVYYHNVMTKFDLIEDEESTMLVWDVIFDEHDEQFDENTVSDMNIMLWDKMAEAALSPQASLHCSVGFSIGDLSTYTIINNRELEAKLG